jgi:hypothetical protein
VGDSFHPLLNTSLSISVSTRKEFKWATLKMKEVDFPIFLPDYNQQ